MADLDTILQNRGLEGLPFGCTTESVREELGEPELVDFGEGGDEIWEYESLGLSLTFWVDYGCRLGYIGTERAGASINGQCLIGSSKHQVRSFIEKDLAAIVTDADGCIHEDGRVQSWLDVDSLGFVFWFIDGILYSVDWTLEWKSETSPW